MGRKKVAPSMKVHQVSISLPQHLIERLDLITSHRSRWVKTAIENRLSALKDVDQIETRRLLALVMSRFHGDVQKEVILKSWFDELLPDSGE